MTAHLADVTVRVRDRSRLPDWAVEFASIVHHLQQNGTLEQLADRLRLARAGYAGLDVALFLLAFFCWGKESSLSEFGSVSAGWGPQLASLGGRSSWPSASAVSRALRVADGCDLDAFGAWALGSGSGGAELLADPLAMAKDTQGSSLAVFDFDPTVEALRLRALPEAAELPPARRRSAKLCAPGYSGRKRGETQFSITPLASAGAALWLQAGVEPGNCHIAKAMEVVAGALEQTLVRAAIPAATALVRIDGAGGHAAAVEPLARRGIHHLVRLAQYAVLDLPEVRRLLAEGVWQAVPDSGSGPRRQALDIGYWQLGADGDGVDAGRAVVPTRLVVSRVETDEKHGAGVLLDGWHYELFGTDLDAGAWPAAETVELYCGRAAIENRFAQEARELHLHHTFSYTPAGQRLAVLVGMWLWNLRTVLGARLAGPLGDMPAQAARSVPETVEPVLAPTTPLPPDAETVVEPAMDSGVEPDEHAQIQAALAQLPWQRVVRKHPGWRWEGALRCPADHEARFHGVHRVKIHKYAQFKVGSKHCGVCQHRPRCTTSTDPGYSPVITVALADALPMGTRLRRHKPLPKPIAPPRWSPPRRGKPGPLQARAALLLPAELRKRWVGFAANCSALVRLPPPVDRPVRRDWVAQSSGARQHRRLTWKQHLARYALNAPARLTLEVPDSRYADLTWKVLQLNAA
jgi:hypothetical protein